MDAPSVMLGECRPGGIAAVDHEAYPMRAGIAHPRRMVGQRRHLCDTIVPQTIEVRAPHHCGARFQINPEAAFGGSLEYLVARRERRLRRISRAECRRL